MPPSIGDHSIEPMLLDALTDRTTIVALAILGAIIAMAGGMLGRKRTGHAEKLARLTLWAGYAISLASVALFIIAGFLSNR
jgi:Na+-driven multidrug efflux pump